jgi:ankyrin repeat protein
MDMDMDILEVVEAVYNIFMAAREGDAEEVAELLDADPDLLEVECFDKGSTLLYDAALYGYAPVARVLLARGADVNVETVWGGTPLYAATHGGHEDVVALLLSSGAGISWRIHSRPWTALLSACYAGRPGHLGVVRLLLQHMGGKGLDERDCIGRTALCWASARGCTELTRALLLGGADHTITDNNGDTPAQIALHGSGYLAWVVLQVCGLTEM